MADVIPMPRPALVIAGETIRRDSAGRYCLNDLHRAAGGELRHRPGLWLRLDQAEDLVTELIAAGGNCTDPCRLPVATVEGRGGGTYVARELVYAYAMWISPAFHLRVIRAYDALVTAPPADPMKVLNDPAALRGLLLDYAGRVQRLEQRVAEQAPKVEALERISSARGELCLTDAAKALQMRRKDLIAWMQEHAWIHKRDSTNWKAYQPRINSGHLVHRVVTRGVGSEQRLFDQVLVTPKGIARLGELLQQQAAVGIVRR